MDPHQMMALHMEARRAQGVTSPMLDTQESEVVMSSADAEHIANMSKKMSIAKAAYDEKRALEVEERSRMKQDNKALRMRVKELEDLLSRIDWRSDMEGGQVVAFIEIEDCESVHELMSKVPEETNDDRP